MLAAQLTPDHRVLAYFLTGRSAASRERELAILPNGDVSVRTTDPAIADDALRHYVAVAQRGEVIVVGNGSQVEPLADAAAGGEDTLAAFGRHDYEPDPPIFTPRIWVLTRPGSDSVSFGWAARAEHGSDGTWTGALTVGRLGAGEGVLLSTYDGSAEQVSTSRGPAGFTTTATELDELVDTLWDSLAPELRVAALCLDPEAFRTGVQTRSR